MKMMLALPLLAFAALPSIAAAQESASLLDEPRELRSLSGELHSLPGLQEQGGQVGEIWMAPRTLFALSAIGRISFPGSTEVTIDNLWYSDFFNVGWGFSLEADLMSFVTPSWGVGGYISGGWDQFGGETLHFFNGDFVNVDNWDQTSIIVGGKFQQQFSPLAMWEGRLGVGWVHYNSVKWSGVDAGVPFSNEELFKSINRAVFEMGFRTLIGNRHIAGDIGFGFRWMGAAARGADVTNAIDPDLFYTFTIELGLTARF
jgi:hypothetical protein